MTVIDRTKFNNETTTSDVLEGIDITGRKVLITGGSSGLGTQTALALASKGAHVIITARDMEKVNKIVEDIKKSSKNEFVEAYFLELDSFKSIREFVDAFKEKHDSLDILINNAGIMACPHSKTQDGFEMQFGTNHLGHFLLTGLLVPLLSKGKAPRIVNVSSARHQASGVVFEDIAFKNRDYDKWLSYGQAKTANILHALELEKRLANKGIHAYSLHPGVIKTNLVRHLTQDDFESINKNVSQGVLIRKNIEQGAATQVYAATAPELEGKGGLYLSDCQIMKVNDEIAGQHALRSFAVDSKLAEKLWTISEEMVGEQFNF
jgi:NAD(P)-dependent dehydrogenase (short-subunit alcohol dehydrogenase family)